MPKLTEDLFAVPDGDLHPRWFRAGDEVSGAVAKAAKAQGKLADEPARKHSAATKSRGAAPENK